MDTLVFQQMESPNMFRTALGYEKEYESLGDLDADGWPLQTDAAATYAEVPGSVHDTGSAVKERRALALGLPAGSSSDEIEAALLAKRVSEQADCDERAERLARDKVGAINADFTRHEGFDFIEA